MLHTNLATDQAASVLRRTHAPPPNVEIVVTPGSGEGRALSIARRLRARLRRRGFDVHIGPFKSLEALTDWARSAGERSRFIVCVGGDATLSATAPAAIRTGAPLVPVPGGFGNVFARVFGHRSSARRVAQLLAASERVRVDVGVVHTDAGEEAFLSHRSYGFLEDIQQAAERGRRQPRGRTFRLLWYGGVAQQVLFGQTMPGYQVEVDGVTLADDAVIATVANVETYAGFLPLTPDASPVDGLFDVFVIPRAPKPVVMLRLLRFLFRTRGRRRGTRLMRGRRVVVTSASGREVLTVDAGALPLLVPPGTLDRFARAADDDVRLAGGG